MTYCIEIEARLTSIRNCIDVYEEQLQEELEDLKRSVPELDTLNDKPYSYNLLEGYPQEVQDLAEQKLSSIKEAFASMTDTVNNMVESLLRDFPELENEEIHYHGYSLTNPLSNLPEENQYPITK